MLMGAYRQIGGQVGCIHIVLLRFQTLLRQLSVNSLDDFDILSRGQHRLDLRDKVNLGVRIAALGDMGPIAYLRLLVVPRIASVHVIGRVDAAFGWR